MTRIAIISDHYLAASGIAALIRQHSTFGVFGPPTAAERLRLLVHARPDVTILISSLGGPDVAGLIEEVWAEAPASKIAFVSLNEDEEALLAALRAGARGALGATLDGAALVRSIADVAAGEIVISTRVAKRLAAEESARASRAARGQSLRVLTPRELAILRLISGGESNKKIAQELSISEHTVRAHVRTIMRKLEVANRVQAATLAVRNGLAVS